MTPSPRAFRCLGPLLAAVPLALGGLALPAAALTFQMVSDADLARQAPLIVDGWIRGSGPAPIADGPRTDFAFEVARVLKGEAALGSTLTVRVLGGVSGKVALRVEGAPRFVTGERVILFLLPAGDGTYEVLDLTLGAFHRIAASGHRLALRDLGETTAVLRDAAGKPSLREAPLDVPRDYARFADWLAAGAGTPPDYFERDPAVLAAVVEPFDFLPGRFGHNIRWFDFDTGGTVSIKAEARGQEGLPGGGFAEIRAAAGLWTDDPGSGIRLSYGGTTAAPTRGLCDQPAHEIRVAFEDPVGAIEGAYNCAAGSILAIGHACTRLDTAFFQGEEYEPIYDGLVDVQNGAACFFERATANGWSLVELFAHELGHVLGLAHSEVESSVMMPGLHGIAWSGTLYPDDRAAIAFLYPNVAPPPPPPPPATPAAPSNLTAAAESPAEIHLAWRDNASNETGYRVERRSYAGFTQVVSLPAGATSYAATGLDAATPYEFRVRAVNDTHVSAFSNVAAAHTRGLVGPCVADGTTLCLLGGALRVEVDWKNQHEDGALGIGHAAGISPKSGSFWFFSADNVELLVKALDGGAVNGKYWFFYGALSDVEYWVRVTQTATGQVAIYHNPPGNICGEGDITALPRDLPGNEALPRGFARVELPADDLAPASRERALAGACASEPGTLCLLGGRFEVTVDWVIPATGGTGTGHSVPVSDRTGYFWFFNDANLELVVKALDGRAQNGKFWFFYGALSDVEYQLRVRDTTTGTTRVYDNPAGEICGLGDTQAF